MTRKHGTDNIEATLAEREVQHGPFVSYADIRAELLQVMDGRRGSLTNAQIAGLEMIMHKIARVLNKGNNHSDTWHDIAGFATLVEKSILDE